MSKARSGKKFYPKLVLTPSKPAKVRLDAADRAFNYHGQSAAGDGGQMDTKASPQPQRGVSPASYLDPDLEALNSSQLQLLRSCLCFLHNVLIFSVLRLQ